MGDLRTMVLVINLLFIRFYKVVFGGPPCSTHGIDIFSTFLRYYIRISRMLVKLEETKVYLEDHLS